MKLLYLALTLFALTVGLHAVDKPKHSAIDAAPREGDWWTKRHNSFNKRIDQGNVDLIFTLTKSNHYACYQTKYFFS